MMPIQYQRGQKIVITTEKMVAGGAAMGHLLDGRPIFVRGGALNEVAEVALTRIKKDFAEGQFLQATRPSVDRVVAPFLPPALAGASWHYLAYPAQLGAKEAILHETLHKIGHFPGYTCQVYGGKCNSLAGLRPIVGSPKQHEWRYRNKIELTFGVDESGQVALGFHAPGRYDLIVPTDDVALFPKIIKPIIATICSWANREKLSIYDARRRQGLLRNLVVRRAEHTSDLLVNIVTTAQAMPINSLKQAMSALPLTGLIWSKNTSAATIVRVDEMRLISGKETLTENFLGLPITYGFDSFFQTNITMAAKLASTLLARLKPHIQIQNLDMQIIDGYAGVGGFGLCAALYGAQVVSIESHPASSADARKNAAHLEVADHMTFINRPMEEYLMSPNSKFEIRNSVLIVDPPRAGLHPKAVKAILQSGIKRMFYVSCNPATLARDLSLLASHSLPFTPTFIQPFDFFPQTPHLETLVELQRKSV